MAMNFQENPKPTLPSDECPRKLAPTIVPFPGDNYQENPQPQTCHGFGELGLLNL
jgi:hypothetical protein